MSPLAAALKAVTTHAWCRPRATSARRARPRRCSRPVTPTWSRSSAARSPIPTSWPRRGRGGRTRSGRASPATSCAGDDARATTGSRASSTRRPGGSTSGAATASRPRRRPNGCCVIGGGPAGLEAARVAAERGHAVTLHEAADRLGGQWRLAGRQPSRSQVLDHLAWYERELARLGRRGASRTDAVDAASVSEAGADHVVIATGAAPAASRLPAGPADGGPAARRRRADGRRASTTSWPAP